MTWVFSYGTLRLAEVQRANYGRLLDGVAACGNQSSSTFISVCNACSRSVG